MSEQRTVLALIASQSRAALDVLRGVDGSRSLLADSPPGLVELELVLARSTELEGVVVATLDCDVQEEIETLATAVDLVIGRMNDAASNQPFTEEARRQIGALVEEIDRIIGHVEFPGTLELRDSGRLAVPGETTTASVAQLFALAQPEVLTFEGPLVGPIAERSMHLAAGLRQADVIAAINGSALGSAVLARAVSGVLSLRPRADDGESFSVTSDRPCAPDQSGIGLTTIEVTRCLPAVQ